MPVVRSSTPSGLAARGLGAFVLSFSAARIFTSFYPEVVVETGGIHFHHFWYGLALVLAAGWLGIASNRPQFDRLYAVVFGIGTGLIGDEIGLLLTFGNYHSMLTFEFFVAAVALASIAILALSHGGEFREELLVDGKGERLIAVGTFVCVLASLPAAADNWSPVVILLLVGGVVAAVGAAIHLRYLSQT